MKVFIFLVTFSLFISCNKSKEDNQLTNKVKKEVNTINKLKNIKKTSYDNIDPLKIDIKYPKKTQNGVAVDVELTYFNKGEFPMLILSSNIQVPRKSTRHLGTKSLKAFKHKFKENISFNRSYLKNKKEDSKKYQHVIPEIHKISTVVYPNQSKVIKLKLIPQSLSKKEFNTSISTSYIVFNDFWKDKIYIFQGKNTKDNVIRELYTISTKLPEKLEGNLIASSLLGKAKIKKEEILITLTGWTPKLNEKTIKNIEDFAYIKSLNSWIYNNHNETIIENMKGELIKFKNINESRTILKANLKKELKIYLHKEYKGIKDISDRYKKQEDDEFYILTIPSKDIPNLILELGKRNYGIHKGKSIQHLVN